MQINTTKPTNITSAGLTTLLSWIVAVATYFFPHVSVQIQQVVTLVAGLVSTGYVHGKTIANGSTTTTTSNPRS